jgi:hypothetical protein
MFYSESKRFNPSVNASPQKGAELDCDLIDFLNY